MRLFSLDYLFISGIDNKTIKRVIIYDTTRCSKSQIWQEIGRCSRDNSPGEAIIFQSVNTTKVKNLSGEQFDSKICLRDTLLNELMGYENINWTNCDKSHGDDKCNCTSCKCCSSCQSMCMCTWNNSSNDPSDGTETVYMEVE